MQYTIYTRVPREELRRRLSALPGILSGRLSDQLGIRHGFLMRLAVAFLEKVKLAFIVKSRGGTDEAGVRWKPLTAAYLAYQRRFGRGEKAALKRGAGLGKANRMSPGGKDGLMTKAQEQQWWAIYKRNLAWLAARHPIGEAKGKAAAIAWATMKRAGVKTLLQVYGHRQVEIGRDTGVLFNSLSPGTLSDHGADASYSPPPEQVVDDRGRDFAVGTNVPYAGPFHTLRPLWPEQLPGDWERYLEEQSAAGVVAAVHLIAQGRAA